MKNFKETFNLIEHRIRNLKILITTSQYCVDNNINLDHNKNLIDIYTKELNNLILQDSQLRDFIIKE